MNNFTDIQNLEFPDIPAEDIYSYTMTRSFFNKNAFSVYATDKEGDLLACILPDVSFEQASALVEVLNKPFDEMRIQETELVEVQVGNQDRIFNALKG